MVFQVAGAIAHARGLGSAAFRTARQLAPHVQKGADLARRGYHAANKAGIIDELGPERAKAVRHAASQAGSAYDRLERVATGADKVARAVGI